MTKPPAFQFYATDFLADGPVMEMTYEERGVYATLLAVAWNEGGLPYDHERIQRLLKLDSENFSRVWPAVSRCWIEKRGRLVNRRQEKERRKQAEFRRKQSERAASGWESRRTAAASPAHCSPVSVSSLQSPSPSPKPVRTNGSGEPSPDRQRVTKRAGVMPAIDAELVAMILGTEHLKPLAESKHGRFWKALERELEPYDWLVLDDELREADGWIAANPARAPTVGGLPKFFRGWCRRTIDRWRTQQHGQAQAKR